MRIREILAGVFNAVLLLPLLPVVFVLGLLWGLVADKETIDQYDRDLAVRRYRERQKSKIEQS
jgi:hypothetical protein